MGLKTDIYKAYEKNMSNGNTIPLSDPIKKNIDTLATDITKAIKKFLLAQTWQITELNAFVELDDLEITKPQLADVLPGVSSILTGATTGGSILPGATGKTLGGKNGVNIPKIKASKSDKTGKLTATGHAFVGSADTYPSNINEYDRNGDPEGWNPYSKVRIESFKVGSDE